MMVVKIRKNNYSKTIKINCDGMIMDFKNLYNYFLESQNISKKILADRKFQKANTPRFRNMLLTSLFWKYLTI